MVDQKYVEAQLRLIAALAETAQAKLRAGQYWDGELRKDISRIAEAVREVQSATERR